ncbi:MAG: methyltransferase domain-containing protein [Alphaproteobacteria bacterium]|nr:methyltransferase domain-containing protein [Alphaproteobacteria bacterium]
MTDRADEADNWSQASRQWASLGSPLRPSSQDIEACERAIARHAVARSRRFSSLLLGVTPELASCRWPPGTRLVAVDNSPVMIAALWPAPGVPAGAQAICGDWRSLPLEGGSIDAVVGDGCYATLTFPGDGEALGREVVRLLRPDGLFAIRVFLRPERAERLADLRAAVAAGRVGSVHALKWRIAAAVQPATREGVRLADIWEAWQTFAPAVAPLVGQPGWRTDEVGSLMRYRDNATRYYFPTVGEFRDVAHRFFVEAGCTHGSYELAERCPTFVLRPR